MEIDFGTFEDVPKNEAMMEMFQGLYHYDTYTGCDAGWEFYQELLSGRTLILVRDNGEVMGFATIDLKEPNYTEGHLYFPKGNRRHTVTLMKNLIRRTKELGRVPYTSVTSDYPHIKKCLEILGFREFRVDENRIEKEGRTFDLIHLELL